MQYYAEQTQNIVETTYNLYVNATVKRRLDDTFEPGPYDVICARGKAAQNHEGNEKFRALVQEHAERYKECNCKHEKSKIVSHIVNTIRKAASYHNGGFVKCIDGMWFEVGDRAAKEKIGQTFRDLLHDKYSSSTKAKAIVRIQRRMGDQQESVDGQQTLQPTTKSHILPQIHIPIMPSLAFPSIKDSKISADMSYFESPIYSHNSSNTDDNNSNDDNDDDESDPAIPRQRRISLVRSSFKPLSSTSVLEQLRASIQTVEIPDAAAHDYYPGQSETASTNWMKDSILSNMSAMMDIEEHKTSNEGDVSSIPLFLSTSSSSVRKYGIFSSSTRSKNPFLQSTNTDSSRSNPTSSFASLSSLSTPGILASSIVSQTNPLRMSSISQGSFMNFDMNMDDLLDSLNLDMASMEMMPSVE